MADKGTHYNKYKMLENQTAINPIETRINPIPKKNMLQLTLAQIIAVC